MSPTLDMNFYDSAFLSLISGCALLTWRQYHTGQGPSEEKNPARSVTPQAKAEASKFSVLFLTVYSLVMASDWLQGKPSYYAHIQAWNN
jgi:hypothetical protein